MEITNESLVSRLDTTIINKVKQSVQTNQPLTFTNDEKKTISDNMKIIQSGILSWEEQFVLMNGRKPTYSDMREEFG
jgi:hypothetical protein